MLGILKVTGDGVSEVLQFNSSCSSISLQIFFTESFIRNISILNSDDHVMGK